MTHVARLQDALDALQLLSFDAILLDLTLPDSTGFETFLRVQAAARHAAIIVLAGAEHDEIAARALREGAHDCLFKDDIDRALLRRTIRHAVERRRFEETLIRKRDEAEQALRESEARFRQLAEQLLALKDQPAAVVSPAASESASGTETVLVVEDETNVRAVICKTLRVHGYTVLEAASASEAFVRVREHDGPIDLLLTDVVLAGMSGPAMAEGLATKQPSLRTLFMSGHADDAIARHGIVGSDVRFIRKPFTAEALLHEVRDALDA